MPNGCRATNSCRNSLTAMIKARPKGAGWWVFAYGSLLWNPLFPFAESRPATLRGLHRRFCLYSLASRGTPEQPGLVLGLDRGGACTGVIYRLPAPVAMDELHLLWRREMVLGAYRPRWVCVRSGEREIHALTFVVRRAHPQYAGRLTLDHEAERDCRVERCLRIVARLHGTHAGCAGDARHPRSLPRSAGRQGGRAATRLAISSASQIAMFRPPSTLMVSPVM